MEVARMEMHRDWAPRHARLWRGKVSPAKEVEAPPVVLAPRWARLFTRAIDELDLHGNLVVNNPNIAHWKRIALEVCDKHRISFNEIISPRRDRRIVAARHEAFWRCRGETILSYPQIGMKFGGRDHSTVLHGIRAYEARLTAIA